jgi:hypothetical protein
MISPQTLSITYLSIMWMFLACSSQLVRKVHVTCQCHWTVCSAKVNIMGSLGQKVDETLQTCRRSQLSVGRLEINEVGLTQVEIDQNYSEHLRTTNACIILYAHPWCHLSLHSQTCLQDGVTSSGEGVLASWEVKNRTAMDSPLGVSLGVYDSMTV